MATNETNIVDTLYAHPNRISTEILDDLEARFAGGTGKIVDGNNVAAFLIEEFSTITAGAVQAVTDAQDSLYPARAQTMSDLYRHMSDYDYLNLFASPATATIRLQLNKQYLWNNSQVYLRDADGNVTHKKATIPAGSRFLIGSYVFGIYYPIDIIMNLLSPNGEFTVAAVQNNTDDEGNTQNNPLFTLQYNSLVTEEVENAGQKLINIDIPIYQFEMAEYTEDMIANTGFSKRYTYTDEFYAIRVYTLIDEKWVELKQTMSESVYQTDVLTVRFSVETDVKQVKLTLPQVFFTEKMVGSKLRVEVYTSKGALDVDLTNYSSAMLTAEILHNTTYSSVFNQIPELTLFYVSSKITGGSNGSSFEEFKDIVVNRVSNTALITSKDLTNFFKQRGYVFERYLDGILERIYKCHSVFTDSNGYPLSAGVIRTQFDFSVLNEYLHPAIRTRETDEMSRNIVVSPSDNSVTILPSTIYKYDAAKQLCSPVILPINPSDDDLNNNQYTFSPFHVRLDRAGQYPTAGAYDFGDPSFDNLVFNSDDSPNVTQMNIIDGTIIPMEWADEYGDLTSGFRIKLIVRATSDLDVAKLTGSNPDVYLYMEATSSAGGTYWLTAELERPEGSLSNKDAQYNGNYVFNIDLRSNFMITRTHKLGIFMNMMTDGESQVDFFDLQFTCRFAFLVRKDWSPSDTAGSVTGTPISNPAFTNYVVVIRQSAKITLGQLISEMHYPVELDFVTTPNDTYPIDMIPTYAQSEYVVVKEEGQEPTLKRIAEAGDPIIPTDEEGNQIPLSVTFTYKENQLPGNMETAQIKSIAVTSIPEDPYPEIPEEQHDLWKGTATDGSTWTVRLEERDIDGVKQKLYVIYLTKKNTSGQLETLEILKGDASLPEDPNFPMLKGCKWLWDVEVWDNSTYRDIWEVTLENTTKEQASYFSHTKGEIIVDPSGGIIGREMVYLIGMPQIDAKMLYARDGATFMSYCQGFLRSHFLVMDNSRTRLLENTKLYYEPFVSLGNGTYVNSDTEKVELPLDVSIDMQLYVAQDVLGDQDALTSIRERVLTIIDSHFATNAISCSKISADILKQLSDVVKYVDIFGLNGDPNMRTLLCVSNYVSPHLKHIIVTKSNKIRVIERALTINFTAVTV